MSDFNPKVGTIGWIDLTVPDAEQVRDFYSAVVGWQVQAIDMGGYSDFNMIESSGNPAAGICHKRGTNASLPSQWMIYIVVEDLDSSVAAVTANGGTIVKEPTQMGPMGRYAVISDPAGAVCALFQLGS